jgi:hypothetical protein
MLKIPKQQFTMFKEGMISVPAQKMPQKIWGVGVGLNDRH